MAATGWSITLLSRYFGSQTALIFLSSPRITVVTILTICGISGSQINVQTILNVVCAFAIWREITSTSFPFGEMYCTNLANHGIIHTKTKLPLMLKMLCAIAVRLAFFDWPIDARSAVIVVPMLSPSRIGIAPVRPITLVTPSGPA